MTKRRKWLILLLPLGIAVLCLMLKLYLKHIAVLHIPCMLWFLTGLYCPGCGGTRSIRALLQGDLLLSLRCNPAVPLLILLGLLWYAEQLLAVFGRPKKIIPRSRRFWVPLLGMLLAFYLLRNGISTLAPPR